MKSLLNITVDGVLIQRAKRYAAKNDTSLSALIEESLRALVTRRPVQKQNVLEFIETLQKPKVNTGHYSKETYYEDNRSKYGF